VFRAQRTYAVPERVRAPPATRNRHGETNVSDRRIPTSLENRGNRARLFGTVAFGRPERTAGLHEESWMGIFDGGVTLTRVPFAPACSVRLDLVLLENIVDTRYSLLMFRVGTSRNDCCSVEKEKNRNDAGNVNSDVFLRAGMFSAGKYRKI